MNSLGDLLLAHAKGSKVTADNTENVSDSKDSNDNNYTASVSNPGANDHSVIAKPEDRAAATTTSHDEVTDSNLSPPPTQIAKVFPERIIRNDLKQKQQQEGGRSLDQDAQSNASSTDDYVAELLDPNDRPRNVWHMVAGPKPGDEQEEGAERNDSSSRLESNLNDSNSRGSFNNNTDSNLEFQESQPSAGDNIATDRVSGRDQDEGTSRTRRHRDGGEEGKSADRHRSSRHRDDSRERSSHRRDRESGSDRRDRRRDDGSRDRDRRGHGSSRRRRDYSDDEDEEMDERHDRHRRSSHGRGSSRRSRSPKGSSRSSRRRSDRSRSSNRSRSPMTKRNSRTVLVMQLNPRVSSRDLEDLFGEIGRVKEVRLIMDSKTRRHKGIAYIEFEDTGSAAKAFAMNGQEFFGAPMVIQSADKNRSSGADTWHPSATSDRNSSSHHSSSHQHHHSSSRPHLPPNSYRVYVGALHLGITDEMLRSVFEPFGPIIRLELIRDRVTSVSKGYAFITYANIDDGQLAVQSLDGLELGGKAIRVSKSTDKSERTTGSGGGIDAHLRGSSDGRSSRSRDVTANLYELAGH